MRGYGLSIGSEPPHPDPLPRGEREPTEHAGRSAAHTEQDITTGLPSSPQDFGGFFGALFWLRTISVPDLATIESNALLWPGFTAHWPSGGPGYAEPFTPMGAWGVPAIPSGKRGWAT